MRPALHRDERQFRDLIENIPALAWSALADGSNTFVSRRWTEYTGLSAEDTAGWGWRAAVHPDDIDRYVEKWRSSLSSGEPFEDEARIRRAADGEYRWFLARAEPMRDEEGSVLAWYGMLTDIEGRKLAEAVLAGEKRILEMVAKGDSLARVLDGLCRLVEEQAAGVLASILLVEGDHLRHGAAPSLPKAYTDAIDGGVIGPQAGSCGTAAHRAEQVIVSDIATDPLWADYRDAALPHSLRACWSTPIFSSEGSVIATFAMYYREPRSPGMRDQEIIEQMTHLAGVAIQHRLAVDRLRQNEKELRNLIETMPAIAWTIRSDGSNVFANSRWTEYSGLPAQALSGSQWLAAIHPGDLDLHVQKWRASVTTGAPFENEARLRRAVDGEYRWFLVRAMPLQDDGGKVLQWYGVAADIEDRKRAEEERAAHLWFLESLDRIHRAMQGTNDLERMMSGVLEAVLEIFGTDRAWLVYPCDPDSPSWRAVMEHTEPEFPRAFVQGAELPMDAEVARVFQTVRDSSGAVLFGPAYDLDLPAPVADRFSIRSQMAMALDPKVDEPYLFGLHQCSRARVWTTQEQRLFQEIGRRLADSLTSLLIFRSLRESERKLEEAQRIAHFGHWERDFATGRTTVSDESRRIFGVPPPEANAEWAEWIEYWLNLIHPDDRERMTRTVAAAMQSGEPYDTEYRVVRPDGEMRVVHTRGSVTRDESGRPRRRFGVVQDITDVRRAEEHLRASEARFRSLVDFAADAFVLHSEDGTILDVNRQACESTGYTREELVGNNVAFTESDMDRWREHWRRLCERADAGEVFTYETGARRKDGTVFPVEVRVRPFSYGGQTLYIALSRDISERKRAEAEHAKLEERLRQAEKMEAIGRFSSGIAHDFNNVLGGIIAYGEMLFDDAPETSPRQRYAQNVLTAATRGRDLVGQLLAYTRSQRGKRRPTDVCRSVAETLDLVRSSLPASITLHATIPDSPLVVMGDATQLHQIVTNLCSNAIHAMNAGGPLRVAVTPREILADCALSHGNLKGGAYVRLSVEDGGCGMDEATLARIFEAFFTTKEPGRGTGLGLALVYAIVADVGGVIDVKSVPDEGSTFSIYVPMPEISDTAAVAQPIAGESDGGLHERRSTID